MKSLYVYNVESLQINIKEKYFAVIICANEIAVSSISNQRKFNELFSCCLRIKVIEKKCFSSFSFSFFSFIQRQNKNLVNCCAKCSARREEAACLNVY